MENINKNLPRYVRVNAGIATHTSAMHTELHQRLYDLVSEPDKLKLHLTDGLLKGWRVLIDQELDLNRAQRASELTAQMRKWDDKRNGLLTQLFTDIRNNAHSPITTLREPGEKLLTLVRSYKGIQTEMVEAKSAHVDGLLMDLAKFPTETTTLKLTMIIDELKTSNGKFGELSKQRVVNRSKRKISAMKQLRPITDEAFYEIRGHIEAAYILATDDADRSLIMELVDAINRLLASYATTRKSSKAQQNIAKQMELESNHKLIDPLLPKLAASVGLSTDGLTFTGRTKLHNKETHYEMQVNSTGKKQWARLVGGELIFVKTRTSGRGNGKAKIKPKDKKQPHDGNLPSEGKQLNEEKRPASDKSNDGNSDASNHEGKPNDGKGHGSASVTPKI